MYLVFFKYFDVLILLMYLIKYGLEKDPEVKLQNTFESHK